MSNVQVGQVWSDKDKRRVGRLFEVINVDVGLAECVMIVGGKKKKTKIRLNRFRPKYYVLKGAAHGPLSNAAQTPSKPKFAPLSPKTAGTELSASCANVLEGTWGGFGSYALFDNNKVNIIVRQAGVDCYDVKIRLDGHLVYSSVSRSNLDTTLGNVRAFLKRIRDNIIDVVGQ